MTVRVAEAVAWLEGACGASDAQTLFTVLSAGDVTAVDISACMEMHAAVAQVLLRFEAPIVGQPKDDFLRDHVAPALERSRARLYEVER